MKKIKKRYRWLEKLIIGLFCAGVLGLAVLFGIDAYVRETVDYGIITSADAAELEDVDCIIVLGCYVYQDGRPSDMLEDRLKMGVELYKNGAAPKVIMSGDHGRPVYNEVQAMKNYAVEKGVASEDVFMDHAGFSTYESIYRARDIFKAKKVLIVTQEYHLYRALYVAQALGLEAYGVSADYRLYSGQIYRDAREILARAKDFAMSIFKPKPTFLGDEIPVIGNGNVTNDQ